jgi:endonuclease/exonuclease/phosphatase family metal-dependent hydrolase
VATFITCRLANSRAAHHRNSLVAALVSFLLFSLLATATAWAERPRRPRPPVLPRTLTVLTLNLRAHLDSPRIRELAIAAYLRRTKPDVVIFQEVAVPAAAQAQRVLPKGYAVAHRQNPDTGRGLAIATRHELVDSESVVLPGRGRPALGATIRVRDFQFAVVNVHLSPELTAVKRRQAELTSALAFLDRLRGTGHGFIGGDMNFGDGAPEDALLRRCTDAFRSRHRRLPGFTWDVKKNALAKNNGYASEPSRRLDRICLFGPWRVRQATVVLTKALPRPKGAPADAIRLHPSDHFGLMAQLQPLRQPSKKPARRRR